MITTDTMKPIYSDDTFRDDTPMPNERPEIWLVLLTPGKAFHIFDPELSDLLEDDFEYLLGGWMIPEKRRGE